MKLLTKELREKFPSLYSTDDKDPKNILVIAKFFNPAGSGTWYATEYDGKDTFFGLANIHVPELGYFSLSELESLRLGPGGWLTIERDLYIGEITLEKAMQLEGMDPPESKHKDAVYDKREVNPRA